MSMWTQLQALQVLEYGDWLRVTHPSHPGEELLVRHTDNGLFVAYREAEEDEDGLTNVDERVDAFPWGSFEIVGFCLVGETTHGTAENDPNWQELKRQIGL